MAEHLKTTLKIVKERYEIAMWTSQYRHYKDSVI